MSEPFIAQVTIFPYTFAPRNWASCNGQLISIAQNTALFSLIGTFYGGDGHSTFALPNLQGRAAVNQGGGPGLSYYPIGGATGVAELSLNEAAIPSHTHRSVMEKELSDTNLPTGNYLGLAFVGGLKKAYKTNPGSTVPMSGEMVADAGQSQAHENRQPHLAMQFCIAMQGIYPSRN